MAWKRVEKDDGSYEVVFHRLRIVGANPQGTQSKLRVERVRMCLLSPK